MRKDIILYFIFLAVLLPSQYSHAVDDVIELAVTPFLSALQSGDIAAIKPHVAGEMSRKMTDVFARDKNYGSFLKQRYEGAIFSPAVIEQQGNEIIVRVGITFRGAGESNFDLLLQKNAGGIWQIVDQYAGEKGPSSVR